MLSPEHTDTIWQTSYVSITSVNLSPGDFPPKKNYSISHFKKLRLLSSDSGFRILLTGSKRNCVIIDPQSPQKEDGWMNGSTKQQTIHGRPSIPASYRKSTVISFNYDHNSSSTSIFIITFNVNGDTHSNEPTDKHLTLQIPSALQSFMASFSSLFLSPNLHKAQTTTFP